MNIVYIEAELEYVSTEKSRADRLFRVKSLRDRNDDITHLVDQVSLFSSICQLKECIAQRLNHPIDDIDLCVL